MRDMLLLLMKDGLKKISSKLADYAQHAVETTPTMVVRDTSKTTGATG